jgi:hypothetical protein
MELYLHSPMFAWRGVWLRFKDNFIFTGTYFSDVQQPEGNLFLIPKSEMLGALSQCPLCICMA